jgi:hypothetical protein
MLNTIYSGQYRKNQDSRLYLESWQCKSIAEELKARCSRAIKNDLPVGAIPTATSLKFTAYHGTALLADADPALLRRIDPSGDFFHFIPRKRLSYFD